MVDRYFGSRRLEASTSGLHLGRAVAASTAPVASFLCVTPGREVPVAAITISKPGKMSGKKKKRRRRKARIVGLM